ncbi:DUF2141 domain-containing protein [Caenispirillum bisanense]|uniref:DUF2141 domain-containing protein n=1 Tax=Caenispirillum bisanense TaxID=414052 RepID=UPI0031E184EE
MNGAAGAAVALALLAGPAAAAELHVSVTGVTHADGTLRVALYDTAATFRDEDAARATATLPAVRGTVGTTFPDLPPGTYALIVYHDENGNGRLDRFLGMIPTEGYGLSNDPEVSGPPRFEACAFQVAEGRAEVAVRLVY